ncbi:MAG TPA: SCO family protein [Rhodoblastus sp.]|nr:SCO family protein [Rhodoblastus sp.]
MRKPQIPMFGRRDALACGLAMLAPLAANAAELYGLRQDGREAAPGEIGGWRLVYFGYTRCPDVCPVSLQTMALALGELGAIGERITPVFVTVDPERDTPKVVADYVAYFGPRFVGLSPSPEQLERLGREWRLTVKRVETKERDAYLIDHTAIIFLVDPSGSIIGRYPHDLDGRVLANRIRSSMLSN